jgi:Dolichyl-phosphate-mannose-protein mannosyltransferase
VRAQLKRLIHFALGAICIAAFYDSGQLHGGYVLPTLMSRSLPLEELAFDLWYMLWGSLAVVFLALALPPSVSTAARRAFDRAADAPREAAAGLALLDFVLALVSRHGFLLDQPVTDDELAYSFTARLLSMGRVTSIPPIPAEFVRNTFVLADAEHWHGKYPLGHSLALAPFEWLGRPDLLGPLLAAANVLLASAVARRLLGRRRGLLATLLLAISPHFILTHATLLSQTTSTFAALAAALAALRARESRSTATSALAGALLGFGILVRPMPGMLVAAAITLHQLHAQRRALTVPAAAAWALCLVACAALVPVTNYLQYGSPWSSGYVEVHASYGAFQNIDGELSNSLGGAILRENVWLLAWPLSLAFVPWARLRDERLLIWGVVAAVYAYRALVPKTVVSVTGPIYMTEAVPWLCMASADGIARADALLRRLYAGAPAHGLAAALCVAPAVGVVCFWPFVTDTLVLGARARLRVFELLEAQHVERAVVFTNLLANPSAATTWAYGPPNPWPDLRDDVLFLRVPGDHGDDLEAAWHLWRERFPDRRAAVYSAFAKNNPLGWLDPSAPPRPRQRAPAPLDHRREVPGDNP